jgi:hypothetical protein
MKLDYEYKFGGRFSQVKNASIHYAELNEFSTNKTMEKSDRFYFWQSITYKSKFL